MFNHESPLRGETFVTKKIVKGLCDILHNKSEKLYIGNLYAKRDWGHAKDYVYAMWKMLQMKKPKDYVIATGKQYTVKQFVNIVCKELGMKISWTGKLNKEKAFWKNKPIIEVDKKYFRPTEVNSLKGNYSLARKELGWKPKIQIRNLVKEMITEELKNYSK